MSGYLTPSATTTTLRVEESVLAYNGDRIHFLTGSAAEIWDLLDGSSTEADITSVLAARHPDPAVAQETRRFVAELIDNGLVTESPIPSGNGLRVPRHVCWTEDGESVLVADMHSGVRRTLTPTAARVWVLLVAGYDRTEVTAQLADEFADALAAYASDAELRRRHGAAGLELAKKMDWDTINSAVIRAYKHAIVKRERLTRITNR